MSFTTSKGRLLRKPVLLRYDQKNNSVIDESYLFANSEEFERELQLLHLKMFPQTIVANRGAKRFTIKITDAQSQNIQFKNISDTIIVCVPKPIPHLYLPSGLYYDGKGAVTVLSPILNPGYNPGYNGEICRLDPFTHSALCRVRIEGLSYLLSYWQIDKFGNIYYWERIPKPGSPYLYESAGWQVVCLKVKERGAK
ncbi:hypothetical protein DRP53_04510 [candidate division WOR-3 bacterium]|uniref:Uncharacterized protein n=1 Tax=candidate division WOR-3 bacterium TaxID=2052148 RepID=A0A660SKX3_UNCW3|nr:MAG: hypothetical protein DRP53_04510 [candidate division WOR-3 bacterium]